MHSYRAYLLDADGHIIDPIDLTCGDDESAKARAREFVNGYAVESLGRRTHGRDVRASWR